MILQKCNRCDLQYDVSHLAPGSRVRCLCDARWAVEVPREVRVLAQRCSGCGGRLEVGDEACSYCGSALPARLERATLCPVCYERLDTGARHCSACGVAIEPQALTALREDQRCPRCAEGLHVRVLGAESVVECMACEGLWVGTDSFRAICRRARGRGGASAGLASAQGVSSPPGRALEPVTYIPCLVCGERMWRRQFRTPEASSRVVVDVCREHGLWLDPDELARVVRFLHAEAERGRHVDPDRALGPAAGSAPSSAPPRGGALSTPVAPGGGWGLGDVLAWFLDALFTRGF